MQFSAQKKRFYQIVYPSRPNSWEVDEIFDLFNEGDEESVALLLDHVGAIWPVSHSLCFSYLSCGVKALGHFPVSLLSDWIRQILDIYETKGLLGARQFMGDVEANFLGPLRGEAGVAFDSVSTTMSHYLKGISGGSFELAVADRPSTDTGTVYLPALIDVFPARQKNVFFYKLLVSLQWANVRSRIYHELHDHYNGAPEVFGQFPERRLAIDLFSVLQFIKVFRYLEVELPGLFREASAPCRKLIEQIGPAEEEKGQSDAIKNLLKMGLDHQETSTVFQDTLSPFLWSKNEPFWEGDVVKALPGVYKMVSGMAGGYVLGDAGLLLGAFDFTRAGDVIRKVREDEKGKFVALLVEFIDQNSRLRDNENATGNDPGSLQENLMLLLTKPHDEKISNSKSQILLDNEGMKIPEDLAALVRKIEADLGRLPAAYVQAAVGQSGGGVNRDAGLETNEDVRKAPAGNVHAYDEWDYRRIGYRKDWCSLVEKSLSTVRSNFVERTLVKYQPQLITLRRQFELLRTRDRFVRRRLLGDDIDLDALIEALGDSRAGRSPSDRLFIQLLRNERDIATIFLVDMSNSTEGWVGVAIKEALVLLSEALEVVGDGYGIYGFSGMRRSRCELFHIKHLEENYGDEVQQRIAAIAPKEYTRMGPPIRHLTRQLMKTQSKVRLLMTISDGKPEDYDDYKGKYAIEDTRKALQEAQGQGVHTFCITIDKAAHEYLAHMFGKGNYIFVDKVLSLPSKMAQIYRLLTG